MGIKQPRKNEKNRKKKFKSKKIYKPDNF